MANMSYCRFRNTSDDMLDCLEVLELREKIQGKEEKRVAKNLLNDILEFCENEGIIENFDSNRIDEIISECDEE